MSEFDEWFEKNGELHRDPTSDERYLFEAGQQSRQVKIDCLQIELDATIDRAMMMFRHKNEMVDIMQAKIDELESKIVKALTLIYKEKSKAECDAYKGADADLIIGIGYDLHLILKGKEDETI